MKSDLYRPKIFFGVQFHGPLHVVGHRENQVWLGVALFYWTGLTGLISEFIWSKKARKS